MTKAKAMMTIISTWTVMMLTNVIMVVVGGVLVVPRSSPAFIQLLCWFDVDDGEVLVRVARNLLASSVLHHLEQERRNPEPLSQLFSFQSQSCQQERVFLNVEQRGLIESCIQIDHHRGSIKNETLLAEPL